LGHFAGGLTGVGVGDRVRVRFGPRVIEGRLGRAFLILRLAASEDGDNDERE